MKAAYLVLATLVALLFAQKAQAVPPPDFIFSAGSAIAQIFTLAFLFLSAAAASVYQFVRLRLATRRAKVVFFLLSIMAITGLAAGGAYLYDLYYQQKAMEQWLAQSQAARVTVRTTSGDQMATGSPSAIPQTATSTSSVAVVQASSTQATDPDAFFEAHHESMAAMASAAQFKAAISSGRSDYVVLDAREDLEYALGHFPTSTHIRFADLKDGRWQELPHDKYIYVFCWSGMRGQEVADFLRSHKILAMAMEGGADSWVASGGSWVGTVKFSDEYPEERYKKLFTTQQVEDEMRAGVFIVDSREPFVYRRWHIPGSVNIPLMYTPTSEMEEVMSQVPAGAKVITVCDAYVNCFDAKLTGVELERRGHEFLGRYNQPWDLPSSLKIKD